MDGLEVALFLAFVIPAAVGGPLALYLEWRQPHACPTQLRPDWPLINAMFERMTVAAVEAGMSIAEAGDSFMALGRELRKRIDDADR